MINVYINNELHTFDTATSATIRAWVAMWLKNEGRTPSLGFYTSDGARRVFLNDDRPDSRCIFVQVQDDATRQVIGSQHFSGESFAQLLEGAA